MAFNNAKNKMSDEEYNAEVIRRLNDKLPKVATKQANPAAEDANPAPVGKVLIEQMCTW